MYNIRYILITKVIRSLYLLPTDTEIPLKLFDKLLANFSSLWRKYNLLLSISTICPSRVARTNRNIIIKGDLALKWFFSCVYSFNNEAIRLLLLDK